MQQPEDAVLVMVLGRLNDIVAALRNGQWVQAFEEVVAAHKYIVSSRGTIAENWTDQDRIAQMQKEAKP